jgi:3-dehydroquinate synthase
MKTVRVGLGKRSYDIRIESGLLAAAADHIAPLTGSGRVAIITDANVEKVALPALIDSFARAGMKGDVFSLPAGEETKSWPYLAQLCDWLLERGVDRSSHVVALGGGVIGDLVGFAASIVKRGCNFIQIPTTLLSQVDSSVGGKTAINADTGKNLIGAFHQPGLVLIDPDVLDSLPERQVKAGYAEVVKYGLLGDAAFFEWCTNNAEKLIAGDSGARIHAIHESVSAKARIVEADERETEDRRALLNLGHTFGHALEAETGFSDALLHGEGVAAGMALAFRFAASKGLCTDQDAARVVSHLQRIGLPHGLKSAGVLATGDALVAHMMHDKKMQKGTLPFILPRAIGDAYVDRGVSTSEIAAFLDSAD